MSGRFPAHTGIVANVARRGRSGVADGRRRRTRRVAVAISRHDADRLAAHEGRALARAVGVAQRSRRHSPDRALASKASSGTRRTAASRRARTTRTRCRRGSTQFNAKKIPQIVRRQAVGSAAAGEPVSGTRQRAAGELWSRRHDVPHAFPTDPAQAARLFTEFPPMDSLIAQCALAGLNGDEPRPRPADGHSRGVVLDDGRRGTSLWSGLARAARSDRPARSLSRHLHRLAVQAARFVAHRDRADRRSWRCAVSGAARRARTQEGGARRRLAG